MQCSMRCVAHMGTQCIGGETMGIKWWRDLHGSPHHLHGSPPLPPPMQWWRDLHGVCRLWPLGSRIALIQS